jgi:hypothetical protein
MSAQKFLLTEPGEIASVARMECNGIRGMVAEDVSPDSTALHSGYFLIMIPKLCQEERFALDLINQSVFVIDAPGPVTG